MKERFFEGGDYKKEEFKALMPKYYPLKYKRYIREETKLLKSKLSGAKRILEAGVGIGRLIPELAPVVKEFIGIDNADLMLKISKNIAKKYSNVRVVRSNLEKLSEIFPKKHFDFSLCVWNTLGNVKDEVSVLKELEKVTSKSIFVTVHYKSALTDRKNWYKTVGISIKKIDEKNEIFYSETGLKSKAYNLSDMQKIVKKSNLQIKESKVLAGVVLWVELISSTLQ